MTESEIRANRLNISIPARCSSHQCIKGKAMDEDSPWIRNCIICKHYCRDIASNICWECLGTKHLDKFEVRADIAKTKWYKYNIKN